MAKPTLPSEASMVKDSGVYRLRRSGVFVSWGIVEK